MPARQQTLARCRGSLVGGRFMKQFLLSTPAQLVMWLAVLAILVAIGGYMVGRFRGRSDDVHQSANDLLTNFREMHHRGDIADTEFRNIKTVLGVQLHKELNSSGDEVSNQETKSSEDTYSGDNTDRSET